MKKFLKKYIGIVISLIMIGLFIWAYKITPANPKLAHVFVEIIAWYFSIIITLVITFISLKIFLWSIRKIKKESNIDQTTKNI
jgi:hypothetical protein